MFSLGWGVLFYTNFLALISTHKISSSNSKNLSNFSYRHIIHSDNYYMTPKHKLLISHGNIIFKGKTPLELKNTLSNTQYLKMQQGITWDLISRNTHPHHEVQNNSSNINNNISTEYEARGNGIGDDKKYGPST